MTRLTLSLLGAPQLRLDGQPAAFATRKALAVLAYLADEARPATRENLIALLWPDKDIESGRGVLRARELHLSAQTVGAPSDMVADELCSDCALLGDWPAAAEYARAAIAARRYDSLPLVIPLRWTATEALLRAGQAELARDDAQRWGALVARAPRLRPANERSVEALKASGHW